MSVFVPDGKVRICLINAPGIFYGSTMADYGIYHGMERVYSATGSKVVCDSAFKIKDILFVIWSTQQDLNNPQALLVNRDATSIRQLSDWAMSMIQGQFPRIKDPMKYKDKGEQKIILRLLVHLYNFQTSQVGINIVLNLYLETDNDMFWGHQALPTTANVMPP